jgi:hypothetical protein
VNNEQDRNQQNRRKTAARKDKSQQGGGLCKVFPPATGAFKEVFKCEFSEVNAKQEFNKIQELIWNG